MNGEIGTLVGGGGGAAGLGAIWYLVRRLSTLSDEIAAFKVQVAEHYVKQEALHSLESRMDKRFDRLEDLILKRNGGKP